MTETQQDNETIDNGETEVQVTAVGEVIGTGASGEPVKQEFTEEALQKIAETHDDVLVDVDHESERDGKTAAAGWLKKLHVIPGKGLFGKISWTDIGRKLIDNRVFRFLSPAFLLDTETHEPVAMTSVALTNKPSQAGMIQPIINSQPISQSQEKITMEITREELIALIKEVAGQAAVNEEPAKEPEATEQPAAPAAEEKPAEVKLEEKPAEVKLEEKPAEVANEEVKEDKAEEEAKADDKEVIKLESLNSAPAPSLTQPEKWRSLTGRDFIRWVEGGMR